MKRQDGVLDCLLIARRDHPRIGDHGHIGQLVHGGEGLDGRDDRGGLGAYPKPRFYLVNVYPPTAASDMSDCLRAVTH
jgi:hypothetical protein